MGLGGLDERYRWSAPLRQNAEHRTQSTVGCGIANHYHVQLIRLLGRKPLTFHVLPSHFPAEQPRKAGPSHSGFNEFFHTQSPGVTFFRSPMSDTLLPPSSVSFQPTG